MEQNLRTPLAAFLCAIALGSAQAQTLSDNLIAHFPMDGSADDVIGGLIPTDTSGAPAFCPDRFGYANSAACFDGTGVWSFGDVLDLDTADFTIALWCRVESLTAGSPHHDYPLAKGTTAFGNPQHSGYAIGFRDELPDTLSTAFLRRDENDDLQLTSAPTSFSTWRHILVNRCDTLLSLILDGTLVDVDTLSADLDFATNTYFSIGASDRSPNGSITGYFNGAVDDIRIYKGRCLSQAEIDTLAYDLLTVGVPSTEESLVLRMSPNPASRLLRIHLPAPHQLASPIVVLNALGQQATLRTSELTMTGDEVRNLSVDVSGLPNGAYFVVVPTERGRLHGMFVKE